jgi:hypothetical protein
LYARRCRIEARQRRHLCLAGATQRGQALLKIGGGIGSLIPDLFHLENHLPAADAGLQFDDQGFALLAGVHLGVVAGDQLVEVFL